MTWTGAAPGPVLAPGAVVAVGGGALCAMAGETREEAGSLISQVVPDATNATRAATTARTPPRRLPRDRGSPPNTTWSGAGLSSTATAVLWPFEVARCTGVSGGLLEIPDGVSRAGPAASPRFDMPRAGTFASWSRNVAEVGRASGSLLK